MPKPIHQFSILGTDMVTEAADMADMADSEHPITLIQGMSTKLISYKVSKLQWKC